jgi:hypothetical protein
MKSLHLSMVLAFPIGTALGILKVLTGFPYYLAIPCYVLMGVITQIGCRMIFNKATKNKPESR